MQLNRVLKQEDFFTEEEMAEVLRIPVQRLRGRVYRGTGHPPYKQEGKTRVYPKSMYYNWDLQRQVIWSARDER